MRRKLTTKELRNRLKFIGMTISDFAEEAGVASHTVYTRVPLWVEPFLRAIEKKVLMEREVKKTRELVDHLRVCMVSIEENLARQGDLDAGKKADV